MAGVRDRGASLVAEQPPGYGAKAQQARAQPAKPGPVRVGRIVPTIGRSVGMGRQASGISALIVGLMDLERELIRIEGAGRWVGLDRWPGVCRSTVELRKGYWPFVDGHARTSRTVAG